MSTQKNKNLIPEPSREKIFPANPRNFDSRYDSTGIVRQELKFPGKSTFNFRITLNEWGMKPSFPDRKVFSIYFDYDQQDELNQPGSYYFLTILL